MARPAAWIRSAFRLKNYAESRADFRQAVLLEGAARMLRARRRALRLVRRPLAPRQMRDEAGLLVGWGMGTATFPALMFQAEARAVIRRDGIRRDGDRRPRHGPGRRGPRSPRSRPTGSGSIIDQVEFRIGHVRSAGCRHRGRLRPHRDGRHGDPQRRRRRHRQAGGSGHGRRALAAVRRRQCRRRRARRPAVPPRRRKPQRELCRYPRPRRPRGNRGARQERGRPGGAIDYAMHAHGAVFAEVKVDPELGQIRVTRLVGAFAAGRIINPRLGAQPDLWAA